PYADSQPLHSFPTRRSSDLTASGVLQDQVELVAPRPQDQLVLIGAGPPARAVDLGGAVVRGDLVVELRNDALHERRDPAVDLELDRKSTRLNSSHVSISYAV